MESQEATLRLFESSREVENWFWE